MKFTWAVKIKNNWTSPSFPSELLRKIFKLFSWSEYATFFSSLQLLLRLSCDLRMNNIPDGIGLVLARCNIYKCYLTDPSASIHSYQISYSLIGLFSIRTAKHICWCCSPYAPLLLKHNPTSVEDSYSNKLHCLNALLRLLALKQSHFQVQRHRWKNEKITMHF